MHITQGYIYTSTPMLKDVQLMDNLYLQTDSHKSYYVKNSIIRTHEHTLALLCDANKQNYMTSAVCWPKVQYSTLCS